MGVRCVYVVRVACVGACVGGLCSVVPLLCLLRCVLCLSVRLTISSVRFFVFLLGVVMMFFSLEVGRVGWLSLRPQAQLGP